MSTFQVSLVSPEKLLFAGQVDQVDLPGAGGDFGVLAGHAPVVAMLRPGLVTAMAGNVRDRFVVFGGVAEFSQDDLTILAESATSVDDLDLPGLEAEIAAMQESLAKISPGTELDRAIERLDHYRSIRRTLVPTTAF